MKTLTAAELAALPVADQFEYVRQHNARVPMPGRWRRLRSRIFRAWHRAIGTYRQQ